MTRPDLCLNFANTRYYRGLATPKETLNAPADLARWAKASKVPTEREFEAALAVRETIHRLFDAHAQGKTPAAHDFDALNAALDAAPARKTLTRGKDGYDWELDARSGTALSLLAPVLWSAGDLLAGPQLGKVRRCANAECLYLFVDESRAGKRRWCMMSACGNRAKAKRHYHKSRGD
jgi:predicted RNA-binding Zn ribbon-like protein